MARLTALYVYWLRAPMLHNAVVYVGCAKHAEQRRKAAQRRYNMTLTVTKSKPYHNHDQAGARETVEIKKHWLTLFNLVRKSGISKRYLEKCAKTSRTLTGREFTVEHCEHISKSRVGLKLGPRPKEVRDRIGAGNKGKIISKETRALLREVNLGKKQSAETVAKRVAKITGQKRTSEQCERLAASKRDVPWLPAMRRAKEAQIARDKLLRHGA